MTPYVSDTDFTLYVGDVRDVLKTLEAESIDCCVTSPPYLGLRDYGHDSQIGLEGTLGEYVATMVDVFREVRRVLTPTATCWLNLGDSYNAYNGGAGPGSKLSKIQTEARPRLATGFGLQQKELKPKDLMGVPWRVALALQDDGWYLRSDIIWSKPNPMPESVTDRPTKSHEYVFLLTKQARYFYDADAIAEPATWYGPNGKPKSGPHAGQMHARAGKNEQTGDRRKVGFNERWKQTTWEVRKAAGATRGNVAFDGNVGAGTQRGVHGDGVSHDLGNGLTRNARSVWEIQTQQYADAHFAVFPEALPERCIKAGCPEGGTVLDPFMGSGTTALVARRLGRRSVGVELNPAYADLCATRLQQLSLLAEPAA